MQQEDPYLGEKARRRGSVDRPVRGDGLGLAANPTVRGRILSKFGDKQVLYSNMVTQIDGACRLRECVLMVTERALYTIRPGTYKLKRRMDLKSVEEVRMSTLADNFFCVLVPGEHDSLFVASEKTEIVTTLTRAIKADHRRQLLVTFANTFIYKVDDGTRRQVSFAPCADGVTTDITKVAII